MPTLNQLGTQKQKKGYERKSNSTGWKVPAKEGLCRVSTTTPKKPNLLYAKLPV